MWLSPLKPCRRAAIALIPALFLALLGACDGDGESPQPQAAPAANIVTMPAPAADDTAMDVPKQPPARTLVPADSQERGENAINPQFSVGNSQYVFDVTDHSREELHALLKRADEIATVSSKQFNELDIALILHGPDIDWFARKNYEQNKELVDLAARLDALEVIDLKVCQKAMQQYGYLDEDIPAFIDRVPYAPDELRRLEGSGYFRL